MSRIWNPRPLVICAVSYGLGIGCGQFFGKDSLVFWLAAVLFAVVAVVLYMRRVYSFSFPAIIGALFMLGVAAYIIAAHSGAPVPAAWNGRSVTIRGKIVEEPIREEQRLLCTLDKVRIDDGKGWTSFGSKVRLSIFPPFGEKLQDTTRLHYGMWVTCRAELHIPAVQRNPYGFDFRAYLNRRGIGLTATAVEKDISVNAEDKRWDFFGFFIGIRRWIEEKIEQWVPGQEGSILKAVLLGSKTGIEEETRKQFSDMGVAHILAISGLHVGYIVICISFLLNKLGVSKKGGFLITTIVLAFYTLLTGASPSIIRASIMYAILLGGRVLGRKVDPPSSLSAAFLLILVLRPLELFEAGFQLSFAAVAGITLFYRDIVQKLDFLPTWIRSGLSVTAAAQLGILPIIIFYYNRISVLSLFANLIIVPILGIVVVLGALTVMLAGLAGPAAMATAWMVEGLLAFIRAVILLLSRVPFSIMIIPTPNALIMVLYYCVLLIMSSFLTLSRKVRYISGSICILTAFLIVLGGWMFRFKGLEVTFIDVGQGDSILLVSPEGYTVLIDGGGSVYNGTGYDVGENVVLPYLVKRGIHRLDAVIVSHEHGDHTQGLLAVLDTLQVDSLFQSSCIEGSEPYYSQLIRIAEKRKVPVRILKAGDTLSIGSEVRMKVLFPEDAAEDNGDKTNPNNQSLVMRMEYQGMSMLFTGDLESLMEERLLNQDIEKVDVLKVAHHGSRTSTTQEWLNRLDPEVAVISVGENSFGHPGPEVLERLRNSGAAVFRTDVSGSVRLRFEKGRIQVSTHIPSVDRLDAGR